MAGIINTLKRVREPKWQSALRATVGAIRDPEPKFNLQIGRVQSYDEMFSGIPSRLITENDLIDEALKNGRVLVSARGGGAKTVMLGRIAKRASKLNSLPILLSLKEWTQAHSEKWYGLDSRWVRIDYLLRSLGKFDFGTSELDRPSAALSRILIIDGLNEVDGKIAQELIFSLDEYASTAINTSVIVSDRLVRREFIRPELWALYLVLPLQKTEVNRQIGADAKLTDEEIELLRSPYFLNAYLLSGQIASTRSEEIGKWFEIHAGLTPDEITRATEAAYRVYGSSSRTFPIRAFEDIVGAETTAKLSKAGALIVQEESAIFDHHLKHDFLASKFLADHQDLWKRDSFNHVTFSGSSFDAIMMCVEQIPPGAADEFIRAVYDWNLYAVGYALGESRRHNVSPEMVIVILSMFAEKRWDIVVPTRQRVVDSLLILKDKGANPFLNAPTLDKVFDLVKQHPVSAHSEWFEEWKNLFTRAIGAEADDDLLHLLSDRNSVRGWTAANVVKRSRLNEVHQESLRAVLRSRDAVVRWRGAHAIGAFVSPENARSLQELLADESESVRYGAVRSLIELASRADKDLRRSIFDVLIQNRAELIRFPSVVQELRRSLLIDQVRDPDDWFQFSLGLMISFQPGDLESEREKWSRATQEMVNMFAAQRG
ncbi:MAG TPA: HEAT repeat domain-containing protein [Terriglobales bacterium]|nr:HEAT repeat domain-containing protein [Terriglobales bacterium]